MPGDGVGELPGGPQRVAVIIPCLDARKEIGVTVRACRAIPRVDLIVVVDDGSTDDTAQSARSAGAVAVRHSVTRGRASALETGVKVAAMRDRSDWPPRLLLFLDADLGDSAIEATKLVEAVADGVADCAIGVTPKQVEKGLDRVEAVAAGGIEQTTGWESVDPLSTRRCVRREVLDAVMPFSPGWGVDVGMTMDMLVEGFSVVELVCDFHSEKTEDTAAALNRLNRAREVFMAVWMRRLRRQRIPRTERIVAAELPVGEPFPALDGWSDDPELLEAKFPHARWLKKSGRAKRFWRRRRSRSAGGTQPQRVEDNED